MTKETKTCWDCKNFYEWDNRYPYCKEKDQRNGKRFSEYVNTDEAKTCNDFKEKG